MERSAFYDADRRLQNLLANSKDSLFNVRLRVSPTVLMTTEACVVQRLVRQDAAGQLGHAITERIPITVRQLESGETEYMHQVFVLSPSDMQQLLWKAFYIGGGR